MCDIVVSDGEYLEREVMKRIINNIDGADIVGVGKTGGSAVQLCLIHKPHLVFFNFNYEDNNSLEHVWQIRKNDQRIVIILTTADERVLVRRDLDSININEFLLKPIHPSIIADTVLKYLPAVGAKKDVDFIKQKEELPGFASQTVTKEVEAALQYINKHYMDNLSLTEVADAVFLSSYYLSRLFKKEVGVNFSSYLLHKKLDEAKRLLKDTEIPICNISSSLNFSDASYFCKVFKKYFGFTPKGYRHSVGVGDQ